MSIIRFYIGRALIAAGFKILPADTRDMVRANLLYHVPGILTEQEKADVRAAMAEWMRGHH